MGQDLAIYRGLAVHNELRLRCSCVCSKQSWEMIVAEEGQMGRDEEHCPGYNGGSPHCSSYRP